MKKLLIGLLIISASSCDMYNDQEVLETAKARDSVPHDSVGIKTGEGNNGGGKPCGSQGCTEVNPLLDQSNN